MQRIAAQIGNLLRVDLRLLLTACVWMGGLCTQSQGQPQAQARRDSLRKVTPTLENPSEKALNYSQLGFLFLPGQPDSSLIYLKTALNWANTADAPKVQSNVHYWLARAYMLQDDVTNVFRHGHQALHFAEIGPDSGLMARSYSLLGIVYNNEKDFDKALEYVQLALDFFRETENTKKVGTELNNLALIYIDLKDYEKAEGYLLEALELKRETGDLRGELYVLGNLVDVNLEKGQAEEALRTLDVMLAQANANARYYDLYAQCLLRKAEIYHAHRQWENAQRAAEQALPHIRQLQATEKLQYLYRLLAEATESQGAYQAALKWYKQDVEMRDSIEQQRNDALINDLALQREQEERRRIEVESKAAHRAQLWTVIAALVLLGVAILIIYLVYQNKRRETRARKQVEKQAGEMAVQSRELARLHQKASSQKDELLRYNRFKDKVISIISHDLRGPLVSLQELLAMVREGRLSTQQFQELAQVLHHRMGYFIPMLDNLLEWASRSIKAYALRPQRVEVAPLCREINHLYADIIHAKEVELQIEVASDCIAYVDPGMIHLAIRNLLSNGIKFTPRGGRVTLKGNRLGQTVRIDLSDSGIGMSAEQLARLLGENHDSMPGTEGERGAGIGLLLVQDFVRQNNGQMFVASQPGKGTTFTLELPANPVG